MAYKTFAMTKTIPTYGLSFGRGYLSLTLTGAICVLGLAGCATVPPEVAAQQASIARVGLAPPKTTEAVVDYFFTAMKKKEFPAAASKFDAALKTSNPLENLIGVWEGETSHLGTFDSWKTLDSKSDQGLDVREVMLKFEHGGLRSRLSVNQQTLEIASLGFERVKRPTGPASYVNRQNITVEETTIGEAPFVLRAAVTKPATGGPFPGVVLLHDTGPKNLNSSIGPNKLFMDIAGGLSSMGIVVVRYNKRSHEFNKPVKGKAKSKQKVKTYPTVDEEVIVDALAAVKYLKSRPEVDPNQVFLVGHGLGGMLAPEIGTRVPDSVAGLVLLAPPGRPPLEVIRAQLTYLQAPAAEIAKVNKAIETVKSGKAGSGMLMDVPGSYWQDLSSRDGIAMAKTLNKPTLVLRGARDYEIAEEDIAAWKNGLSGLAKFEAVTLPDLNHLFIKGQGAPGPAEYETQGHVDGAVIEKVAAFVLENAPKAPAAPAQ